MKNTPFNVICTGIKTICIIVITVCAIYIGNTCARAYRVNTIIEQYNALVQQWDTTSTYNAIRIKPQIDSLSQAIENEIN